MSAHDDERRGSLNDGNGVGAGSAGGEGAERVVLVTVTYLEMTSPDQFTAPPEWAEPVTVLRAERPTISFYRYLYDTVGADWDWYERRRLSDEALAAIIHDDAVEVFVPYVRGVPAGYVELDRRVEGEVEIAYFGLVPDYIGRRLGPCLLGWALERAWGYGPRQGVGPHLLARPPQGAVRLPPRRIRGVRPRGSDRGDIGGCAVHQRPRLDHLWPELQDPRRLEESGPVSLYRRRHRMGTVAGRQGHLSTFGG